MTDWRRLAEDIVIVSALFASIAGMCLAVSGWL